jgi:hypothetical protein
VLTRAIDQPANNQLQRTALRAAAELETYPNMTRAAAQ